MFVMYGLKICLDDYEEEIGLSLNHVTVFGFENYLPDLGRKSSKPTETRP
jgi:hypothetical protein